MKIERSDMKIIWVSNFYDFPLAGLCSYKGRIYRFTTDYETSDTTIHSLSFLEKIRWFLRKWMFELCVGYHFTYKDGKKTGYHRFRNPKWFWNALMRFYYKFK